MSRVDWIVCERTSRWASALRMALAGREMPHRLRELRRPSELDTELAARPGAITAIEIHRGNFSEILAWLPRARPQFADARFVGLLDRSLAEDELAVADVLMEAGADLVVASPRRLNAMLLLGGRHAARPRQIATNVPLVEQVWASLPWQAG